MEQSAQQEVQCNVGYLDKFQAARHLGIAPRTLDVWMAKRLVPFFKIGRTIRFKRDEIDAFLRDRCRVALP